MSRSHYIVPTGQVRGVQTARLGSAIGSANWLTDVDQYKFVKLVGESQYDLASAGNSIEGQAVSIELPPSGGWNIGGVVRAHRGDVMFATADGLQATLGTGTLAIGDRVVVGTVVAKGTALASYPRVAKATVQPGDVPGSLTAASAQTLAALNSWRVVSLGTGAGAVGTTIAIEKE